VLKFGAQLDNGEGEVIGKGKKGVVTSVAASLFAWMKETGERSANGILFVMGYWILDSV